MDTENAMDAATAVIQELAHTLDAGNPEAAGTLRYVVGLIERIESRRKRQAFLRHGWARAAMHYENRGGEIEAVELRRTRLAIGVSEAEGDEWAAQFQRLVYRRGRCHAAFGVYGVAGRAVWDEHGFHRASAETIARENREDLARQRGRAHRAKFRAADQRHPGTAIQAESDSRARDAEEAAMMPC